MELAHQRGEHHQLEAWAAWCWCQCAPSSAGTLATSLMGLPARALAGASHHHRNPTELEETGRGNQKTKKASLRRYWFNHLLNTYCMAYSELDGANVTMKRYAPWHHVGKSTGPEMITIWYNWAIKVRKCRREAPKFSLVGWGRCPEEMTSKSRSNGPVTSQEEESIWDALENFWSIREKLEGARVPMWMSVGVKKVLIFECYLDLMFLLCCCGYSSFANGSIWDCWVSTRLSVNDMER